MIKPLPASRRAALMEMGPDEPVRLYSYQHPDAWAAARDREWLTGDHGHVDDFLGDWGKVPYEWMRSQMAERIPGFSGELPVWAWLKRHNPRSTKWIRRNVRITAIVPRRRILLSDYDSWHLPLNDGAILLTREEDEAWEHHDDPVEVQATWHRCLEIRDMPWHSYDWAAPPSLIQACVDRIRLDEIVGVRMPGRRP
jgi:hypothetical protein